MEIKLPSDVKMLIDRLRKSGYDCYAVGGCVRDSLRGLQPHDWDLTTSAQPDEIERIFADFKTVDIGKKYGTIAVMVEGELYEITTYRVDGTYTDSRHPDEVSFSDRLRDDLARRDFSVNAISGSVKQPHVIDTDKCIKCGKCYTVCRFGAVKKA